MTRARDLADIAGSNAFTAADETKLDGIETSADVTDATNVTAAGALMDSEVTNLAQVKAFSSSDYATAAQGTTADAALPKAGGTMTGAITFAAGQTFDGRDVSADGSKLDGIEANAKDDQTITAGSGLTGGGTGNVTLSHADTSSQASVNNSGATVVQDVTVDTYGHVTGLGSKTMTLADLGYTGATNANYITNNNQLTNGAGYSTFTANQSLDTSSSPTFSNPNLTSALRMGGTQVLSSGRALTNITSVDSTTVTALSNAGVGGGGGWELLQNTDITSDISYIEYNFPTGYSEFRFILNRFKTVQTSAYSYDVLRARLKNSSGTLITTGGEYEYQRSNASSCTPDSSWSNIGILGTSQSTASGDPAQTFVIDVVAPRRSDVCTTFISHAIGQWANGNSLERDGYISAGIIKTAQDNTGIRFYGQSYNIDSTSDEWLVYGVPDA